MTDTYGWSRGCLREVRNETSTLNKCSVVTPSSILLGEEGKLGWLFPYRMIRWNWKPEMSKGHSFMELPEKKITWETFVLWNVSTHLVDRLYKQFSFENKLFFLEFEGTLCYLSFQCWGHLLYLTVCGWGIWAGLSLGTLLFHMVLTWVHIVAFSKWLAGLVWRDQECKCLTPWWWCLEGWSQLDPYSFRTSLGFFFIF